MSDAVDLRKRANRFASLATESFEFARTFASLFEKTRMPEVEIEDAEAHRFDQLRKRAIEALEDTYGPASQRCSDMAKNFPVLNACAATGTRNVVRSTIPDALQKRGADLQRYADKLEDAAVDLEHTVDPSGPVGFGAPPP